MQVLLQSFKELTPLQLYHIVKNRIAVFVVEQNAIYQDLDEKDLKAYHLSIWENNQLMSYARLLAPDTSYPNDASIGRVISTNSARGKGYGKKLMNEAVKHIFNLYPNVKAVTISAQLYLKKFYESFGFKAVTNEVYLEDGIDHIQMRLQKN